ncbi:glycosyltransferase [Neorhizobium lilium]|uniref:Glycosyltransferase n=1 Tax=Neorhizobium lilium TaxID=2503024 RepID=A0A3S3SXC1_9HYPH|nr:glycosyltransferase [Neorhizobium lilium]RWX76938.1 glycosyltransferase [Neorhizobium lilium]
MKILCIIADTDPKSGGPVEGWRLNAEILTGMGHVVEFATLDDPNAPHVAAFPFPVHACGPGLGRYGYTSRLRHWIVDHANGFDVAVVNGLWNHSSIGGWQGLREAKLPYVVFTHGMMDPWFKQAYPFKHLLKQAFWLAWQGKALRDASRVLFTCEEERRLAHGEFWGFRYREHVVAYGTDGPTDDEASHIAAFDTAVPDLRDKRFLLFLSRIHPKKGCDLLVEAFAEIANEQPDLDLVIAGPDQAGLRAGLESRAEKAGIAARIHWPGMLLGDAKWGAFRRAEAFVLPSHQENFGIVVAEAMACGTPVIITDKVNIWREVETSGGGIVRSDTLDGVREALRLWIALSGPEKDLMRKSAREGFERYFHVDAAAQDLASILQVVSNEAQSARRSK